MRLNTLKNKVYQYGGMMYEVLHRDGCDDCDGVFDTIPPVILIVTTVTNRHTACSCRFRQIALPFRVRFTEYSI